MSVEIETLVSEIEDGHQPSETLEHRIAQIAGVLVHKDRRLFLSNLDAAVDLPSGRGWNFALSSGRNGARRYFGARIFKPNTEDEVLAHAQAWHPAEAVVLAFLKGMGEIRRLESGAPLLETCRI
jgi:hypothetical protein